MKSIRWAKYLHKIVYKWLSFRLQCVDFFPHWARMAQIMLCLSTQYTHNFHPNGHGHIYRLHLQPKSFLLTLRFNSILHSTIRRERSARRLRRSIDRLPIMKWYHDDIRRENVPKNTIKYSFFAARIFALAEWLNYRNQFHESLNANEQREESKKV